jgi:NADPH2:quinone reductase
MTGGSLYLTRPTIGDYIATRDDLVARTDELFGWITDGRLRVRIAGSYRFSDAAKAHEDLAAGRTAGKLLLTP